MEGKVCTGCQRRKLGTLREAVPYSLLGTGDYLLNICISYFKIEERYIDSGYEKTRGATVVVKRADSERVIARRGEEERRGEEREGLFYAGKLSCFNHWLRIGGE